MSEKEFDAQRAVKILNHPVRIKIIELLATKGPLPWKELSKGLGASTGGLYHHLDMLEHIVTRDADKRYALTGLGDRVYEYLKTQSSTRDEVALGRLIERKSVWSSLQGLLIPRSAISSLTSNRRTAVASAVGLSLLVLASMVFSRSRVILLAFFPSQSVLLSTVSLVGSLFAMTAIMYVGTWAAGSKSNPLTLLASASLALLPLVAFSLLLRGLATSGSLGILADRNALTFVFALFQGWGACIVGAGACVATGMRVEKALLVSLVLLYITVLAVFAQGQNLI